MLNSDLVWRPGTSPESTYTINGDKKILTLTAGPETMNWGGAETSPMILYQVSGNFEAQVEVICNPSSIVAYSGYGFGVRSRSDHLTWLQFEGGGDLFATENRSGATLHLNTTPYGRSNIYLRIKRVGDNFSFSYSANDDSWTYLVSDYNFNLPQDTEIYMFVFTPQSYSLSVQFSDFRIFK
jgi:regulation of enolase protein 1 (concanavalin A-like superfamily)